MLSIFPASSVEPVDLLLTLLQASINRLRAMGVDIQPEMEETMEGLNGLVKHLQERASQGTLRSKNDTYTLLSTGGGNPGNGLKDNLCHILTPLSLNCPVSQKVL